MSDIYFPQLNSGAIAQYSLSKERSSRTVRNVMRDGRLISYPDFEASRLSWSLSYSGLSGSDAATLKASFDACAGPLLPLTLIDPTGNALTWSSDLSNVVWQRSPQMKIIGNASDPTSGSSGFTVTNDGQSVEELTQTITIPSNYQYCLSIYVASPQPSSVVLIRRGSSTEALQTLSVGNLWTRIQSSGRLNDGGSSLTVGISLTPGQSVSIYAPQLEAQAASSPYRATSARSGIYANCFWATDEISITADGPYSYSAQIYLETTL